MLSLAGVEKRYARAVVLRDVTMVVEPGEVVAVTGRNGCGKSTLFRVAAGLTAPTHGTASRPARLALTPDRFTPPERMSGRAYLRHHGRMRGLDGAAAVRRAELLAERLEVSPGLDVSLTRLSQGNARKVQLAQAFLVPVDLLLLDEAAGVLDEQGCATLGDLVDEAAAAGACVLRTDPAGVITRADRRLTLAEGVLEREPSAS